MRSLGTLKQVDVVLRRVDAEYTDPLDLRPDSRLGVVGLVEAQRRGLEVFFPSLALSTDNAAMIAAAAYPRLLAGQETGDDLNAEAVLPLA